MKRTFLAIISFICLQNGYAQKNNVAGTYMLKGVMEVASGFELKEDSTFEFYFAYGALDRIGSGKWYIENDNIILNSKPYPGKDFKLVSQSSTKNTYTTVKIEDQNKNLYTLVYCLAKTPVGDTVMNADENGIIRINFPIDSIHLLSELCSERINSFPIGDKKYNNFTFHFEPWITDVFFKSFPLHYADDHLEGKQPLLDDKVYNYYREK